MYDRMEVISKILVGLIAAIHLYIMWFEMFAWETRGRKIFRNYGTLTADKKKFFVQSLQASIAITLVLIR